MKNDALEKQEKLKNTQHRYMAELKSISQEIDEIEDVLGNQENA